MKISCRMSHPIVRVHHVGAGVIAPAPFLSYRKLLSYTTKSLRQDAHSREEEMCRKRPRSARECAKAHSLFSLQRMFLIAICGFVSYY